MNWALIKGELVGTVRFMAIHNESKIDVVCGQDIIYLRIGTPAIIGSTEELSTLTNADATPHTLDPPKKIDADDVYTATCSDFASNSVFLIGTDEGKILKCSKTYHSNYLARYDVSAVWISIEITRHTLLISHYRAMKWAYTPSNITHSILRCLSLVQLTGQCRFGTLIHHIAY